MGGVQQMTDLQSTENNLEQHLENLTRKIGERSISRLWNLEKAAAYIEEVYDDIGIETRREPYSYKDSTVANIVADITFSKGNKKIFLLGAHYDSLSGTVGADDNASSIAVQLEIARELVRYDSTYNLDFTVRSVSFALEEPPAYGTRSMGSRKYVQKAKKTKERIDGMICLEMVGYTCSTTECQSYPFPLMYFGYPKIGNFIGIVGNLRSRKFTESIFRSFQESELLPVEKLIVPWSGYLVPNVRLSDHASFWDNGYKAVMITDTAFYRNPHYHRTSDTMRTLDIPFMAKLVHSLVNYFISQGQDPYRSEFQD